MAEILTDKLVKFAFGSKANYSAQSHADFVYFAKDVPLIHANGMWRGVSGVSLSGNTLTITTAEKDSDNSNSVNTNVTVDLSSIATTSTQRANWDSAYNFVKSITDDDTDTVINKWQEIVDFLAGIKDTTLQEIVNTKADKATKVFGLKGDGGAGGIKVEIVNENGSGPTAGQATLGTHFRIGINNQMTRGTYTKLTVDDYGLVTAGTTLAASDIPTLEISKINNLQTTLNGLSLNTHTHSVKINGTTKTIAASGGTAVDLGSYLSLSGGTVNGNVTATKFIGALQGNADTATKLSTKRKIFGNDFDGSADVSGNIIHNSSGDFSDDLYYWGLFDIKNTTTEKGFIGFYHNVNETNFPNGIKLAYNTSSGTTDGVVFMNDNLFTYNGNPIFYKGSADFNSAITEILGPMADDFTKLSNRVTAVETQLKWIEIS